MKKFISIATVFSMILCMFCVSAYASSEITPDHTIVLSSVQNKDGTYTNTATIDGKTVTDYTDYIYTPDPSVKKGYTIPDDEPTDDIYIAHDIVYYPVLDVNGYTKVQYDDDTEWAYYYTATGCTEYIFATLPVVGNETKPSSTGMMHTAEDAYQNSVLHINKAGTYSISGTWHGQIKIDLDTEDAEAFDNEDCKVTLILNGVDITCTVAPAVNFYAVYECDNEWEDRAEYSQTVDTTEAGANVILADGTVNNVSGANVFRMLKAKEKDADEQSSNSNSVKLQKKLVKTDAAFYSYNSMNIDGNGTLNITSTYEGLDSELHLTINGGNINIYSQDDGMNVNEDNVSVLTFNGGVTHIFAGLGNEGDGIDSNGYLVVNGGTLISNAKPQSDSGLDSDCGTYIYGGNVIALGSTMDGVSADSSGKGQASMNLKFSSMQNSDEAIIITDTDENIVFAYDPNQDTVTGSNARTYQGAIISSPSLKQGETYHVYIGGDVNGTKTTDLTKIGIFDSSSADGFTDDAVIQGYTENGNNGMGQQQGEAPAGEGQQQGEAPAGEGQQQQPQGEQTEGNQSSSQTPPEKPTGENTQNNQTPPDKPNGQQGGIGNMFDDLFSEKTTEFTLTSVVNNFSNVGDYSSAIQSDDNIFVRIIKVIVNFFNKIAEFFNNLFQFNN